MADDQDTLLPATEPENESASENEDYNPEATSCSCRYISVYVEHTKITFFVLKVTLIASTLAVLILLPLYMETVSSFGDVYSIILTNVILSALSFALLTFSLKFSSNYKNSYLLKEHIKLPKLIQLSFIYFLSLVMILYSLDRKKVLCHMQDPLKSLLFAWIFVFYFFYWRKSLPIQKIMSSTLIIAGLFVAVDYSFCNEFKCRGYEREFVADDTGDWSWTVHSVWSFIYVAGLALFAAYLLLFEHVFLDAVKRCFDSLRTVNNVTQVSADTNFVSSSESSGAGNDKYFFSSCVNSAALSMWIHIFGIFIVLMLLGTGFLPYTGKGSNSKEIWHNITLGIRCHFSDEDICTDLPKISWLFLIFYLVFVATSIHFLMLTRSSLYTVATMATAIPFAGIFWSFFQALPIKKGLIVWKPMIGAEAISSIFGLLLIMIGLIFLNKAHFNDYRQSKNLRNQVNNL